MRPRFVSFVVVLIFAGALFLSWLDRMPTIDTSRDPVVDLVGVQERPEYADFGWRFSLSWPSPAPWHQAAGVTIGKDSFFYATKGRCEAQRLLMMDANPARPWLTFGPCRWMDFRR